MTSMNRQQINEHTVARDFVDNMLKACPKRDSFNAYILERFTRQPHLCTNTYLKQRLLAEHLAPEDYERIVDYAGRQAVDEVSATAIKSIQTTHWQGLPLSALGSKEIEKIVYWLVKVANTNLDAFLKSDISVPHVTLKTTGGNISEIIAPVSMSRQALLETLDGLLRSSGYDAKSLDALYELEGKPRPAKHLALDVDAEKITFEQASVAYSLLAKPRNPESFSEFYAVHTAERTEEEQRVARVKLEQDTRLILWGKKIGYYCRARIDILSPEKRTAAYNDCMDGQEIIVRALPAEKNVSYVFNFAFPKDAEKLFQSVPTLERMSLQAMDAVWISDLTMDEVRREKNLRNPRKKISFE